MLSESIGVAVRLVDRVLTRRKERAEKMDELTFSEKTTVAVALKEYERYVRDNCSEEFARQVTRETMAAFRKILGREMDE